MSAMALPFAVFSDSNGTLILWEYHSVTVHDELLALCAEMHAEGAKLTYDSIRARRGGGSRRDISRALLAWHQQRARDLSAVAIDLSEDVERLGVEFVRSLWSAMAKKVADKLQEVKAETQIAAHYADDEIAHLHGIIGDQLNEIDAMKARIQELEKKLEATRSTQDVAE